jgi:hypothetical protein
MTIQMLPAQQITPGMGNPYKSASDSFVNNGLQQTQLIKNATGGRRKKRSVSRVSKKRSRRRHYRGGDIVVPPLHGALFNRGGYQDMATGQASSYINSRAAASGDGLVGKPGITITTGGASRRRRRILTKKRTNKTKKYTKSRIHCKYSV